MVMHQSVFRQATVSCSHALQDRRHRKAYLASGDGRINVLNIQSGVTLKECFEEEDAQAALEQSNLALAEQMNARVQNTAAA